MKRLAILLLLIAAPLQAKTVAEIQQRAEEVLTPLYTGTWRPAQEAYFVANQRFGQCLTTHNAVPQNDDADPEPIETEPDNAEAVLHDQTETCEDVLGELVSTNKPYTLWIDVCEGPSLTGPYDDPLSPGRTLTSTYGFRIAIFFEHQGVVYERWRDYGVDSGGDGANFGCFGQGDSGWLISAPGAARTGETATGTGTITDAAVPQAFGIIQNCTTGEEWTADGNGDFSIVLQIGRQTFLASDAARTRQREVTRDVRAGDNFVNNVPLNAAYSGCP